MEHGVRFGVRVGARESFITSGPGPATQTDSVLCHYFCFVADVNMPFELHVKKRFDDLLFFFRRCCSSDHMGSFLVKSFDIFPFF